MLLLQEKLWLLSSHTAHPQESTSFLKVDSNDSNFSFLNIKFTVILASFAKLIYFTVEKIYLCRVYVFKLSIASNVINLSPYQSIEKCIDCIPKRV